jgi:hypothetical protein
MADVPDELVIRGVEQVMESDCELHDAEPGTQMPTGNGNCVNRLGAKFVRHLSQLLRVEGT